VAVSPVRDPWISDASAGFVHSWDLSIGVDGPGTRLVVFLSGCPVRCAYCQNPDTWPRRGGQLTSLDGITGLIGRYRPFIDAAGGGFTASGGEPLQQAAFTAAMFTAAKQAGLHTALDTSGFLGIRAREELLAVCDLVLLDIKAGTDEGHRRLTRRPIGPTLKFARRLAESGQDMWVRYVLVPGFNDSDGEVDAFIDTVSALDPSRVEILPFHKLGESKYERLGIPFALADTPPAGPELVLRVRGRMLAGGLPVAG
jgi:pyruvate formate lyase activating enzyme